MAALHLPLSPAEGRKRYREFFLNFRLLEKVIQQGRREWGD